MADILNEIIAHKRKEVATQRERLPLVELERRVATEMGTVPFYSMKEALESSKSGIIAEFKRRSPSKGWLFQTANPDKAGQVVSEVTRAYESAGASALSVLTDEKYFGGTMADLREATGGVKIPVMRKEFIVDEYQLFEAKLAGASAVLLIAAAITPGECERFTELANQLGLEVLLVTFLKRWRRVFRTVGDGASMKAITVGTIFGPFIGVALSLYAVQHTETGIASTLMALVPIFILVPTAFMFKEKITARQVIGAVISIAGASIFFL